MSFRPPVYREYGNYYDVQNERNIVIDEESNFPINNKRLSAPDYTGLAAQQPFPNNVRIKFSAPSLKLKKSFKLSKKTLIILLILIIIFLFAKCLTVSNVLFSSNRWYKSDIPWKGPKEFEVDPEEFNNFEVIVSGQAAQGNLFITRSSGNTSSINIKVQILLSNKSLQNRVEVVTLHDSSNYILRVKTPEFCKFPNCILININITFPKNLNNFGRFSIDVVNLNINNDDLKNIAFDKIDWKLNPSINVKNLKSRDISIHSHGSIAGNYHIDKSLLLQTSNEQINATAKSFSNSVPESIYLITSNSIIQGSFPSAHLFEARTSNGKIDLNITSASHSKRQNAGKITLNTSNGSIDGVYDVDSEWHASTSNGRINVKLNLINLTELIRISGMTSNGSIGTLISDSYKGRFHLQTSNSNIKIRKSNDINYDIDGKSLKTGYKGKYNNNELSLFSSNGKINLSFF